MKKDKYIVFADWCNKNGIKYPGQEYPAIFGDGLVGVKTNQPIKHRQAFIYVPFKCLVTLEKVRTHPQLGQIILENEDWFDENKGEEGATNTFLLFLLHETQKGHDSFWKPWLDVMPQVTQFHDWDQTVIDATQDPALISQAMKERESGNDWRHFMACLRRYPNVFKRETINKELILRLYGQICTRTFGSSLHTSMMVPMADNYNHANVIVRPYLIHKASHLLADKQAKYFSPSKFMNDYSLVMDMETAKPG